MKLGRIEKWFMNRPGHTKHVIKLAEKLLNFVEVKENQRFLEVGCGSGAVSKHIAENYHLNVTGTDLDADQIELALESVKDVPTIRFLEADATKLPFKDNDFDIVLSFGVMHHIPNWLDALEEIKRVLKPKGFFVYWDLLFPKWSARIWKLFTKNYGITTLNDLNSFMEKNSFTVIYTSSSTSLFGKHYEAVFQR
ncbi:MAG: class I SAM-dependent methyltransferase [Candidatus Jordarchaeum sp.]|uniref:class I SAM-dependent methyltransferase n=1 Tax=Candidatus Jordarchaeum sp. TaxID=2823881 RepID=UPI00404A3DBB